MDNADITSDSVVVVGRGTDGDVVSLMVTDVVAVVDVLLYERQTCEGRMQRLEFRPKFVVNRDEVNERE